MQIRFTLNKQIDADLIARIEQKANDGSINEAAKFLMRFWCELESTQNVTSTGQNLPSTRQDTSLETETQELNLSGLDAIINGD